MKILLTNDDGVHAEGINALYTELKKEHKVLMVAPDREQSASSHALTLSRPLRMHKFNSHCYSCEGTPTDSVLLAVLHILNHKKPDMVISGINHGANMGEDIMYSGTVAAAIEGSQLGIPAIATSMVNSKGANFKSAAKFIRRLLKIYPKMNLDCSTILNVNFPGKVKKDFKDFEFTFLGSREYDDIIDVRTDPRGQEYYWIAGVPIWKKVKGSDIYAVEKKKVSITPIHFHFTHGEKLSELNSKSFKLPR
ncbi:MAG: 5'/3'-nucleotidase SurE [candidate division Zixibacteria bacterium]|nr:5'/3'-nucleotidase SurE [candidate division Zixibacteria bacterium]